MSVIKGTINIVLMLEAHDTNTSTWYLDVTLAVHAGMKRHTGVVFVMGIGVIITRPTKKKVDL